MSQTQQEYDSPDIAELEARALELQRELVAVQAELTKLCSNGAAAKGREVPLAPAWDAPIAISSPPDSQAGSPQPHTSTRIYLQALQPYHALRTKWHLSSGLESALTPPIHIPEPEAGEPVAADLRLFGLLSNGQTCELVIPFAHIAQDEGVVLGRDPENANYAIDDESVSRRHLQLRLDEHGLVVSDLGSTNGTAVNNTPLTPYDNNRPLQDGDTLTMGRIPLQIEFL